jgi:molecular chaperone GrpE (heat shock protein)
MPAPLGNQNAAKAKRWEAAILRAIEAWPKEPDETDCSALIIGLNRAAHQFVKNVYERGDLGFFKEFGDRMDGKAAQAVTLSGDEDNPLNVITKVERVIVNAKD